MRAIIVILSIFLCTTFAFAQDNIAQELKSDIVTIQGNQMNASVHIVVTTIEGNKQISLNGRAPVGQISRDNFVFLMSMFLLGIIKEAEDFDIVEEVIGEPDLTANLTFTSQGMQIAMTDHNTGEMVKETQTWKQIFRESQ
ncbi:MAG: hypothetical protein N2450_06820 [bacterium]|nr:hypothetical protein [bacterium]